MLRRHPQIRSLLLIFVIIVAVRTLLGAVAPDLPWWAATGITVVVGVAILALVERIGRRRERADSGD